MIHKIAFFDSKPYDRQSFNQVNQAFGFDITYFDAHLSKQTVSLCKNFDAVCVFVNDTVNKAVINQLVKQGIQIIALRCAGYNNVDLKAVDNRLRIVRVPAYSPYAVAEHAVALMLSLNRQIYRAYHRTRDGNFSINGLLGFDMHDKTAGIIGVGTIGKCLVSILKGFGMNILAYDPCPNEDFARESGMQYVTLEALYKQSDIISLHCPLNTETVHMIDSQAIKQMKKGVMIINTGRGKLIDTRALINSLKTADIGFAGLDVYEEESEYFFEDRSLDLITDDTLARLLTFPNVLITSHQAFFTQEALHQIALITLNNLKAFFDGEKLENEIRC